MNFGKNVKEIRESRGLSQRELGERLGVTQQTIAQYEALINAPKSKTVDKIAAALDVTFRDLTAESTQSDFDYEEFAFVSGLTSNEGKLLKQFDKLNRNGQDKAIEQVKMIAQIPAYMKPSQEDEPILTAAHERTDIEVTDEMRKHDDDIMDDDSEWE